MSGKVNKIPTLRKIGWGQSKQTPCICQHQLFLHFLDIFNIFVNISIFAVPLPSILYLSTQAFLHIIDNTNIVFVNISFFAFPRHIQYICQHKHFCTSPISSILYFFNTSIFAFPEQHQYCIC